MTLLLTYLLVLFIDTPVIPAQVEVFASADNDNDDNDNDDNDNDDNDNDADHFSNHNNNDNNNDNCSTMNVILGTRSFTEGTECDDTIIGAPVRAVSDGTGTILGATLRGLERHDILQGSEGDDKLYGDEGNDGITASDGTDRLYGGPGNDVLQAGFGADLLVGGRGTNELYAGPDDDILIGGPDTNFFDCGDGNDMIIDFNPAKGDTQASNCEVVLTDLGDKEFYSQSGVVKSKLQALGVGSFEDPTDLEEIGKTIN
jgi:Ca2+-binding RTX toxin-like protein